MTMMEEGQWWSYVSLGVAMLLVAVTFMARNFNEWANPVRLKPGDPPLPPGKMGWPLIGETLRFMTEDYHQLYQRKLKKFGRTWKTHVFGNPTICMTTADNAREVLITKQGLFEANYPDSMRRILGMKNFMFLRGAEHLKVKRFFQVALRPESIRSSVGQVEEMALLSLRDLEGRTISVLREARLFSFNAAISLLFGASPSEEMVRLGEEFELLDKAIFSLAIDLPWTTFRKGIKARERILKLMKKKIYQRRSETGTKNNDVMSLMLQPIDGETLTDEEIADSLLAGLFAGQDTTATALHWGIYHLSQCPEALEDLTKEVDSIKRKKNDGEPLTWDDFKNMPFASAVVSESVRLNVASFLMRQAQTDVIIDGYTIPKGWTVVAWTRFFHTDPANVKDPMTFNPRRFMEEPKPSNLMIWGAGARTCPGYEFSKLEGACFFYHLINKYTWEVVPNPRRKLVNMPVPHLSDGLQIRLHKRDYGSPNTAQ
ncbi:hypothetical protein R1sor_000984 [Riccia sorocarpa]|uniref:Cytochrome P450 n=1 Tax=Riccia sorocarpa TaxID=122646 RepID=A0ABD3GX45_9MARC